MANTIWDCNASEIENATVDHPAAPAVHIYIFFNQSLLPLLMRFSLQSDRGQRAKSQGHRVSGRVLPQVQLLPLRGGREVPEQQDAVRRPPGPGRHAGSGEHH